MKSVYTIVGWDVTRPEIPTTNIGVTDDGTYEAIGLDLRAKDCLDIARAFWRAGARSILMSACTTHDKLALWTIRG